MSPTYVATNSIRHLTSFIRHLDTRLSVSHFERSVLGVAWRGVDIGEAIDADVRDQTLLGMINLNWKGNGKSNVHEDEKTILLYLTKYDEFYLSRKMRLGTRSTCVYLRP